MGSVWLLSGGQCSDWEGQCLPCSLYRSLLESVQEGAVAWLLPWPVPHVFGCEEQPKQQKTFSLMF